MAEEMDDLDGLVYEPSDDDFEVESILDPDGEDDIDPDEFDFLRYTPDEDDLADEAQDDFEAELDALDLDDIDGTDALAHRDEDVDPDDLSDEDDDEADEANDDFE